MLLKRCPQASSDRQLPTLSTQEVDHYLDVDCALLIVSAMIQRFLSFLKLMLNLNIQHESIRI